MRYSVAFLLIISTAGCSTLPSLHSTHLAAPTTIRQAKPFPKFSEPDYDEYVRQESGNSERAWRTAPEVDQSTLSPLETLKFAVLSPYIFAYILLGNNWP